MEMWKTTVLDWVNCLKLVKHVTNISDLEKTNFFSIILKKIFKTECDLDENIQEALHQFIRDVYPDYELGQDGTFTEDTEELLYICSLLILYCAINCEDSSLREPPCSLLSNQAQQKIMIYIQSVLKHDGIVTREIIRSAILETYTQTPKKSILSPNRPRSTESLTPFRNSKSFSPSLNEFIQSPEARKQKHLESLTRQLRTLKAELATERDEKFDLIEDLKKRDSKILSLTKELESKRKSICQLNAKIDSPRTENEPDVETGPIKKSESTIKLRQNLNACEKKLEQIQFELSNQEDVNKSLNHKIKKLQSELNLYQCKCAEYEDENKKITELSKAQSEKIYCLQSEIGELKIIIESQKVEYKTSHNYSFTEPSENLESVIDLQLKELQVENEKLQTRIAEITKVQCNYEETIASQKLEIIKYRQEITENSEELRQLHEDNNSLKTEYDRFMSEFKILQSKHRQLEGNYDLIQDEYNKLSDLLAETNRDFKTTKEQLQEDLIVKNVKLESKEKLLNEFKITIEEMNKHIINLQVEITQKNDEIDTNKKQINKLENLIEKYKSSDFETQIKIELLKTSESELVETNGQLQMALVKERTNSEKLLMENNQFIQEIQKFKKECLLQNEILIQTENEVASLKKKLTDLESKQNSTQSELKISQDELKRSQIKLDETLNLLKDQNQTVNGLQNSLLREEENLKTIKETSEKRLMEQQTILDQNQNEIKKLRSQIEINEQAIANYQQEINNLIFEIEKLKEVNEIKNNTITSYEQEINNLNLEINDLKKDNETHYNEINKYQLHVDNLNLQIEKLGEQIESQKKEIIQDQTDKNSYLSEIDSYEKEIRKLNLKIDNLQEDSEEKSKEIGSYQQYINNLNVEISKLKGDNAKQNSHIDSYQKQVNNLNLKIQNLLEGNDKLTSDIDSCQKHVHNLDLKIQNLLEDNEKQNNEIDSYQKQISNLNFKIQKLIENNESQNSIIKQGQADKDNYLNEIDNYQKEINNLNLKIDKLKKDNESQNNLIKQGQIDKNKYLNEIENQHIEQNKLKTKLQQLENDLDTCNFERQALQNHYENVNIKLKELTENFEQVQADYKTQISDIEAKFNFKLNQCNDLEQEVSNNLNLINDLNKKINDFEIQVENNKSEIQILTENLETLQREYDQSMLENSEKIFKLQSELNLKISIVHDLENDNQTQKLYKKQADSKISELNQKNIEFETQINAQMIENTQLKQEIENWIHENEIKIQQITEFKSELQSKQLLIDHLETEYNKCNELLKSTQDEAQIKASETKTLLTTIKKEHQNDLTVKDKKIEQLELKIQELNLEIESLEKQLISNREEISTLNQIKSEMCDKYAKLQENSESNINSLKSKYDELLNDHSALVENHQIINRELNDSKSVIENMKQSIAELESNIVTLKNEKENLQLNLERKVTDLIIERDTNLEQLNLLQNHFSCLQVKYEEEIAEHELNKIRIQEILSEKDLLLQNLTKVQNNYTELQMNSIRIEQELSVATENYYKLKVEHNKLLAKNNEHLNDLETLKASLENLQVQNEELIVDLEKHKLQNVQLEQEKLQILDRIAQIDNENKNHATNYCNTIEELKKEIENYKELENEHIKLVSKHSEVLQDLEESQTQYDSLENKHLEIVAEFENNKALIQNLSDEKVNLLEKIEECEKSHIELSNLDQLKMDLESIQQKYLEKLAKIDENQNKIEELLLEKEDLSSKIVSLDKKNLDLSNDLTQLQNKMYSTQQIHDKLKEIHDNFMEEHTSILSELNSYKSKLEISQYNYDNCVKDFENVKNAIENLHAEKLNLISTLQNLEREKVELNQKLEESQNELFTGSNKYLEIETKYQQDQVQIEQISNELMTTQANLEQLQSQYEIVLRELDSNKNFTQQIIDEKTKLFDQISNLESKNIDLNSEIVQCKREICVAHENYSDLEIKHKTYIYNSEAKIKDLEEKIKINLNESEKTAQKYEKLMEKLKLSEKLRQDGERQFNAVIQSHNFEMEQLQKEIKKLEENFHQLELEKNNLETKSKQIEDSLIQEMLSNRKKYEELLVTYATLEQNKNQTEQSLEQSKIQHSELLKKIAQLEQEHIEMTQNHLKEMAKREYVIEKFESDTKQLELKVATSSKENIKLLEQMETLKLDLNEKQKSVENYIFSEINYKKIITESQALIENLKKQCEILENQIAKLENEKQQILNEKLKAEESATIANSSCETLRSKHCEISTQIDKYMRRNFELNQTIEQLKKDKKDLEQSNRNNNEQTLIKFRTENMILEKRVADLEQIEREKDELVQENVRKYIEEIGQLKQELNLKTIKSEQSPSSIELQKLREAYEHVLSEKAEVQSDFSHVKKMLAEKLEEIEQMQKLKLAYEKVYKENDRMKKDLDLFREKHARDKEEIQNHELRMRELRSDYDMKLEKMKVKMKQLYADEIGKAETKNEMEKRKLCEEYDEKIQSYEKKLKYLQSEMWKCGNQYLGDQWDKERRMSRQVTEAKRVSVQSRNLDELPRFSSFESLPNIDRESVFFGSRNTPLDALFSTNSSTQQPEKRESVLLTNDKQRRGSSSIAYMLPLSKTGKGNRVRPSTSAQESTTNFKDPNNDLSSRRRIQRNPVTGIGPGLHIEDEDTEMFNSDYLYDLQAGRFIVQQQPTGKNGGGPDTKARLSELQVRNSMCPPHLKSSYPAETQFHSPNKFKEEDLKCGNVDFNDSLSACLLPDEKSKRKDTYYKKPGPPTPCKNGDPTSLQSTETREILREQNPIVETQPIQQRNRANETSSPAGATTGTRKQSTPNRMKAFFTRNSLSRRDDTEVSYLHHDENNKVQNPTSPAHGENSRVTRKKFFCF